MTQKEAIIQVLEDFGGRAKLSDIYPRVIKLAEFKEGSDKKATIRATLQRDLDHFRKSAESGWWELMSFQEQIVKRDIRIKELEEENAKLKSIKTEDEFVKRLVREAKKLYKHEKDKIEVVRQMLYNLGRSDAEEELDAWIEGREYKPSFHIDGDYVVNKSVMNEVNSVASGAIGINIPEREKEYEK